MTGILSPQDIKILLKSHYTGHIACVDEAGPYVVPFTYFYDEDSHTIVFKKIYSFFERIVKAIILVKNSWAND